MKLLLLSSLFRRRPRAHRHRLRCLPRLPPEIWMLILRYAAQDGFTGPHGQLDAPVSFLHVSSSHSDLLRRLTTYRSALETRAVLSVVCRDWHAMAQELLYDFVWVSRARQAKSLAATLAANRDLGHTLRRLHIETLSLERCDPAHLRTIIELSPRLAAYSDYRSIRRQPHSSPDHLLSTLARPGNKLQRLSWTNYDYDSRDQSGCMSFFLRLSPALGMAASDLDYLELSLCATDLVPPSFFPGAVVSGPIPIHLPALRTLKLTLDNITFSVLSQWSMPALKNISVLSTDFSYTGDGFANFFKVHGHNILQLELGHSTGAIEEHYLTTPPQSHHHHSHPTLNLADWCPNLREFICSADAEWNWQSPDWIAPHILLPAHPNVEIIGIRDMNKRFLDDLDLYLVRHSDLFILPSNHRGPFFRLAEQLGSLLRSNAFPKLRVVRDMSWESALMRKVKRMPAPGELAGSMGYADVWWDIVGGTGVDGATTGDNVHRGGIRLGNRGVGGGGRGCAHQNNNDNNRRRREDEMEFGRALISFWKTVEETCRPRGVVLQDWIGEPVTV